MASVQLQSYCMSKNTQFHPQEHGLFDPYLYISIHLRPSWGKGNCSYLIFRGKTLPNGHYNDMDIIMSTMASHITSLTIVYSSVYSGADQRKHQSSASLAFVRGIYRSPVNSPHKGQWRGKCFHLMTLSWKSIKATPMLYSQYHTCPLAGAPFTDMD